MLQVYTNTPVASCSVASDVGGRICLVCDHRLTARRYAHTQHPGLCVENLDPSRKPTNLEDSACTYARRHTQLHTTRVTMAAFCSQWAVPGPWD